MPPIDRRAGTKDRRATGTLSPTEYKVLAMYADSGSQQAVAANLNLKLQTVKNHLQTVYRKLEVNSAIAAFKRMGWLAVDSVDNLVDNSADSGLDKPASGRYDGIEPVG
jgi:DNA-binding CsgD family transcriptional regulator